jgi:hypothetical protein
MSHQEPNIKVELSLLENGLDFILKGIDELFDEEHVIREYSTATDIDSSRYKYGVIHLFSGFLLLLKERLSRHVPELIFKGKISEVKQKIAKGRTPNKVDLDEALERLEFGPRVVFSEDDLDVIRLIQRIRNEFEHYKVSVNKHYLWQNVSIFLELIDQFLIEELHINIESSTQSVEIQRKIHKISSVWKRVDLKRRKDIWNKGDTQWNKDYTDISDFLMKTIGGGNLFAAAKCFAEIRNREEISVVSEGLLEKFDSVLEYIEIYDAKTEGLSQPELDFIIDTEIEIIETIAKYWQNNSFGYEWLMRYLDDKSYKLQEFCVAAIIELERYWSNHPNFIDDLIKVSLNNPFDSMNDSEDSCDLIDYLDSPRQVAMKCLVKHYKTHPKVVALLQDRAIEDQDEQVRQWASNQLRHNEESI